MKIRAGFLSVAMVVVSGGWLSACVAQSVDPKLYSDMKWREIGPMRAGRTRALGGRSQPACDVLSGHGERWGVEDNRRGRDMAPRLGFAAERVDRVDCCR